MKRLALALVALAALIIFLYARRAGDFAGYLLVGELALQHLDIYRDAPPNVSTWPPFFAMLCVPLALLARVSLTGARVLWLTAGWVALYVAMRAIFRLVPGSREVPAGPAVFVLLPLLLCIRWILSNFEHLQINIIILAIVAAGLLAHREGRGWTAATLLGIAAAMKVMPILFVPYFAWRRQWRAAFQVTALAALWSLTPVAVYGPRAFTDQLRGWLEQVRAGWSVGKMNISVYAALDRTIGHGIVPLVSPGFNDLAPSRSPAVAAALAAILLVVLAAGLVIFRSPYDPSKRIAVAEWSVVLLVANLFGTVAWKAYLVVLLLPMTLFVSTWRDVSLPAAFRSRLRAATWITFVMGLLAADALVGRALAWRLEMAGLETALALMVLVMLFWYRRALPALEAA